MFSWSRSAGSACPAVLGVSDPQTLKPVAWKGLELFWSTAFGAPSQQGGSHCSPLLECEWKEGELSSQGQAGFLEQRVPREASGCPNASWNSPGCVNTRDCQHQGSTWPFLAASPPVPAILPRFLVPFPITPLGHCCVKLIPALPWMCSHSHRRGCSCCSALGQVELGSSWDFMESWNALAGKEP